MYIADSRLTIADLCSMFRFLSLAALLLSCTNDGRPGPGSETPHPEVPVTGVVGPQRLPAPGCYELVSGGDTARLQLQLQDTLIQGTLVYDWKERDGNTGTFKGAVRDSLLKAYYTFESEGMTSVREVTFLIKGDQLLEGYGPVGQRGDTVVFLRPDALQFSGERPFLPCR